MKLYRVHHTDGARNGSAGYSWHIRKEHAEAALAGNVEPQPSQLEEVHINTSRPGLLEFAKRYASHPDNG